MSDDTRAQQRLESALSDLGSEFKPPVGWQAEVLAAVSRDLHVPWYRRLPRWWPAVPSLAVAATAAVIAPRCLGASNPMITISMISRLSHLVEEARPLVAMAITERTGTRSTIERNNNPSQAVADSVVDMTIKGASYRVIWIYRDDVLVSSCPGAVNCREADGQLTASERLGLGRYVFVGVASNTPLPPSPRSLFDLEKLQLERHAAAFTQKPISVTHY